MLQLSLQKVRAFVTELYNTKQTKEESNRQSYQTTLVDSFKARLVNNNIPLY